MEKIWYTAAVAQTTGIVSVIPRMLMFAVVAAVIVYAFRRFGRGRHLFRARVLPNGVKLTGMVPSMNNSAAEDFLEELQLPIGSWVDGHRTGNAMSLAFSPDFPKTHRQQVRNVLLNPSGGRL